MLLEIILLVYFSRKIRGLAVNKNESKGKWTFILIITWILSEILGIVIGLFLFGQENLIMTAVVGWAFAVSSYFLVWASLNSVPDTSYDQMIDEMGSDNQEQ
jgi:hypothetical protein